jgi:hypothetical protein
MPSKERAPSHDKSTPKQRPPWHTAQTFEAVDWLHQPETTVQRAAQAPRSLTPQDVSRLQRAYGNRAVLQLPGVGGAGMVHAGSERPVQRQEEEEEPLQAMALQRQLPEEEEEIQAMPDVQRVGLEGGPVPPEAEAAIARARGGGQPLDGAVQAQMGETMGYDFSGVRVHTDAGADKLNKQLSAKAFTTGSDIFFKRGAYEPDSSGGQELIAHELSHVVQQGTGQVSGGGSGMTVRPAGDRFERQADVEGGQRPIQRTVEESNPANIGGEALGRIGSAPVHVKQEAKAFYAILSGSGVLSSSSYGSCVGLALWDKETATGLLVHFWASAGTPVQVEPADAIAVVARWVAAREAARKGAKPVSSGPSWEVVKYAIFTGISPTEMSETGKEFLQKVLDGCMKALGVHFVPDKSAHDKKLGALTVDVKTGNFTPVTLQKQISAAGALM